jgi:hypothetical protein
MNNESVSIEHHTETGAPEIVIPKKNIILDATVMNTVLSCGRLTDFRFNHNFVSARGKSNSLEVGTLCHKVKEVYNKHRINGFDRSLAVAQGLIAGELYANGCRYCADWSDTENKPPCGHNPQEYPGLKNTPEDSNGHTVGWKYALLTMEQYFEFYKNDPWVILEAEIVKGRILYEDDNIRILWKAKLDEVVDTNQGIFPVDTKTEKQRRPSINLNNQFMGQCHVMQTRSMIVDHIGFQTSLKPEEKFRRSMRNYSADLLLEWQSETLPAAAYKLLEMNESNYWPPNYTHCENKYGNCPFIEVCGSDRNMREEVIRVNFVKGLEWNPTNERDE